MLTLHFSRQVPVISDVYHCVACRTMAFEIIRNILAVNATHQIHNIAFPFVSASRDALEVHVADDCVAQVAAVVTVVVDFAEEVLLSDLVDVRIDLLLDVLKCDCHDG